MNVYKPGAFRLYGSSKLGQNRFLVHKGKEGVTGDGMQLNAKVFFDSLVCYVPREGYVDSVLTCSPLDDAPISGNMFIKHRNSSHHEMCFVSNSGINSLPLRLLRKILQYSGSENTDHILVCRRWYLALTGSLPSDKNNVTLIAMLHEMIAAEVGDRDKLKLVPLSFSGVFGRCYVYGHAIHRCELNAQLKGRPHKKNTIYWVCFPDLGVWYQKCHDADCKETMLMKSNPPLPGIRLELDSETKSCTLINETLDVSCVIACEGRGIVRHIPFDVLYCVRIENVRPPQSTPSTSSSSSSSAAIGTFLCIPRLHDNSVTIIRPLDIVCFQNDPCHLYSVVQSSPTNCILTSFPPSHQSSSWVCEGPSIALLSLVGAVIVPHHHAQMAHHPMQHSMILTPIVSSSPLVWVPPTQIASLTQKATTQITQTTQPPSSSSEKE